MTGPAHVTGQAGRSRRGGLGIQVSRDGFRRAGERIGALGPAVLVQEGGYDLPTLGDLTVAVLAGVQSIGHAMTKNSDAEAIRSMLARYDPAADVSPGYHSIAAAEQITRQPGVPGGPERDTDGTRGDRSAASPGNRISHRYREAGRLRRPAAAGLAAAAIAAAVIAGLVVFSAGQRQAPTPIGAGGRSATPHPSPQARSGMPRLLAFHADAGPASERAALAALTANAARLPGLGHGRFFYVRSNRHSKSAAMSLGRPRPEPNPAAARPEPHDRRSGYFPRQPTVIMK